MAEIDTGGLQSKQWDHTYRTSSVRPGRPVDMLHDFYIPVLRRSIRYDRVAGYFSSSSLAAASQGFSAFVGKQGRIRLIVGADLATQDVDAILEGDQEHYASRLQESLGEPEGWPEDVERGVDLLAWMVANGYLDVRVAFRVHGDTGESLAFHSNEDGYMHEKWALFYDEEANRLLAQGSLNESHRALIRNAENLSVDCDWWSDHARERVDEHEYDFEELWHDRHPHFRVLTLPEAVRDGLVKRGRSVARPIEIDGTTAAVEEVPPPSAEELLRFAVIRDGPKLPGGRFVGMETAPVEPWPHQSIVARRLVETWPYSYLLCDEVGLGKTIEAGLAIRSLLLSGFAQRILVAPPASLKEQWQREMESKFLLPFALTETSPRTVHRYIHPYVHEQASASPFTPDLNILSSAILQRRDRASQVAGAGPFDLVLIDEAHAARRQNPTADIDAHPDYNLLYRTLSDQLRGKTRALWLATATPMQLEKVEAWDLLRLMDRAGPFQDDPRLTFAYYDELASLVSGSVVEDHAWAFLRQVLRAIKEQDPLLWDYVQELVIDSRLRQPARKWLERGVRPRSGDERRIPRLLFAGAPLSRVMLRHTRDLLEIYKREGKLNRNLAQREVLPLPRLTFTEAEAAAYHGLEAYCEELSQQVARHGDEQQQYNVGFYKSFLRLRFASSFHAIRQTVRRRIRKVIQTREFLESERAGPAGPEEEQLEAKAMEPEEEEGRDLEEAILKNRTVQDLLWEEGKLKELEALLSDLSGPSTKMRELLRVLEERRDRRKAGRFEQTVIFTRFTDTLEEIVGRLRQADEGMLIGTYSGDGGRYTDRSTRRLVPVSREQVKHMFLQGQIDVLVCTDAAAEGLNLQTANLIINFDLPWNPMKVEQRIGRLDRIGQKHDEVYVLNLCYQGSAEEIVYDRLLRRLRDAQLVMGSLQFSMLPVTQEEFRDLADGRLDEEELLRRAKRRAQEQRERSLSMEIPAEELYDIYLRMEQKAEGDRSPVTLDDIWDALTRSDHLQALGCQRLEVEGHEVLMVSGVEGIRARTDLTVSRDLYETGKPDGLRPNFASYGDPAFDWLLEHFQTHDAPQCVRRVSKRDDDTGVEFVGYVVSSRNGGEEGVRHVFSYQDLEDLEVDERREPSGQDVEEARQELERRVRAELDRARAVPRIERINRRTGKAHLVFSYLLAERLLNRFSGDGTESENFWSLAEEMEAQLADAEPISVTGLSPEPLRRIKSELIFEPKVPTGGGDGSILASPILLGSALGAAKRQADSLKVRRSELTVDRVVDSLERALEHELKDYETL